MLLELARLFSRLYTYKRTHAAYATAGREGLLRGWSRWVQGLMHPRNDRV